MFHTTRHDVTITLHPNGESAATTKCEDLLARYENLVAQKRLNWTPHLRFAEVVGSGGQGVVFRTEWRGADSFTIPVAVKVFSPERYDSPASYDESMQRLADVAGRVAQIQHDHLLGVHNWVDRDRIRMMVMELIDGFDLQRLLSPSLFQKTKAAISKDRWEHLNRVVITEGPAHPRIKAGVAVAIARDCLAGLAALHREGIIHGDVKPSNVMLKRTGIAKLIDFGSAYSVDNPPPCRSCTPSYAAPEVLEGAAVNARSDLASLGYVLLEMLAGRPIFSEYDSYRELLEAKRKLAARLPDLLPPEVSCNDLLMAFCRGLVAHDPSKRFPSAEDAEMKQNGAAAFHRQLVMGNLASEYDNDLRVWIDELKSLDFN
jgi:eukaryotic-like serine/threonine-protein kinase